MAARRAQHHHRIHRRRPPEAGACTADYTVDVASSKTAGAVALHEHAHDSGGRVPPSAPDGQVTTRLDAPLGARVLSPTRAAWLCP